MTYVTAREISFAPPSPVSIQPPPWVGFHADEDALSEPGFADG